MQGRIWIGLAAGVCAAALAAEGAAAPAAVSRYTQAGTKVCKIKESGEPEGQDWLLYRCAGLGGMPVWFLYQDSTRVQVAFGPNNFDHYAAFSPDRDEGWAVEWRGFAGKSFKPYAAIVRMRPVGERTSTLAVYKVWPGKPSCLIGKAADNAAARRIADAAAAMANCPQ